MDGQNKVNWFIGHMKKTMDILENKKKQIDFVLEIVDSRLPYGSTNNELLKIFNNKLIIKVAIKSDLILKKDEQKDLFYISTKNNHDRNKLIKYIELKLKNKTEQLKKKGLINPILLGIVVGLPNIGKSSLINFLANKKIANVENRPGVTRKTENLKINNNIFLMDTPGVFIKNVDDYKDGLNLALINAVNRNIVNKKDLAYHLFDIAKSQNKSKEIATLFKLDVNECNDFDRFINALIAKKAIKANNENELENLYLFFIKNYFDSGFSKIMLEK